MSQIKTKWIEDGAITAAKLDSSGSFTVASINVTDATFTHLAVAAGSVASPVLEVTSTTTTGYSSKITNADTGASGGLDVRNYGTGNAIFTRSSLGTGLEARAGADGSTVAKFIAEGADGTALKAQVIFGGCAGNFSGGPVIAEEINVVAGSVASPVLEVTSTTTTGYSSKITNVDTGASGGLDVRNYGTGNGVFIRSSLGTGLETRAGADGSTVAKFIAEGADGTALKAQVIFGGCAGNFSGGPVIAEEINIVAGSVADPVLEVTSTTTTGYSSKITNADTGASGGLDVRNYGTGNAIFTRSSLGTGLEARTGADGSTAARFIAEGADGTALKAQVIFGGCAGNFSGGPVIAEEINIVAGSVADPVLEVTSTTTTGYSSKITNADTGASGGLDVRNYGTGNSVFIRSSLGTGLEARAGADGSTVAKFIAEGADATALKAQVIFGGCAGNFSGGPVIAEEINVVDLNVSNDATFAHNLVVLGDTSARNVVVSDLGLRSGYSKSLFSTDQMQLAQLDGGAYFGRVGIKENHFDTTNLGETWTSRDSARNWYSIAMSSNGKYQTATDFAPGYLHTSSDYGVTWTQRGTSKFWQAASLSSDGLYQTAVIYNGFIYVSENYGANWSQRGLSKYWTDVAMSTDGRIQAAVVNNGVSSNYIYISRDLWITSTQVAVDDMWSCVAMSSDGRLIAAGTGTGNIYVSKDYGSTWAVKKSGGSYNWSSVAMSSDGRHIVATEIASGYAWVSTNYGDTWVSTGTALSYYDVAMSSNGEKLVASEYNSVWLSTNYGATWTAKAGSPLAVVSLAMSSDGKVISGVASGSYIYTSYADSALKGILSVDSLSFGSLASLSVLGDSTLNGHVGINNLPTPTAVLFVDATSSLTAILARGSASSAIGIRGDTSNGYGIYGYAYDGGTGKAIVGRAAGRSLFFPGTSLAGFFAGDTSFTQGTVAIGGDTSISGSLSFGTGGALSYQILSITDGMWHADTTCFSVPTTIPVSSTVIDARFSYDHTSSTISYYKPPLRRIVANTALYSDASRQGATMIDFGVSGSYFDATVYYHVYDTSVYINKKLFVTYAV
jgi:hypothetical protein